MRTQPYKKIAIPAALGVVVASLYAMTAAHTVVFIDSGELSTVASTLGIAHPTGYPLYTLIAWLVVHLPGAPAPVRTLNLLSSCISLSAVLVFYGFLLRLGATRLAPPAKTAGPSTRPFNSIAAFGAVIGAATLAFSETFWSGSTAVEVYPLHALFLITLLWLFVDGFLPGDKTAGGITISQGRMAHLFAFVLGLSFTNHLSTLYLAPALLFTYFRTNGLSRASTFRLLRLVPAFLLGLTPYLYLPLRSYSAPLMNWGNATGWDAIVRHLSGRQYSVWIFSSADTAARQFGYFFSNLGSEFFYLPLVLAVLGIAFLFRRHRTLFYFFLLLFVGCLFFAVNYDINDIDSYFLLAYIAVAAVAGVGAFSLLSGYARPARRGIMIVGVVFLMIQAWVMYPRVDQSGLRVVEQYSRSILGAVEEGALVISYQWDYFVSASYYLQQVEGYRPDVAVVDKELLRRSWYIGYLRQNYPRLMQNADRTTNAYLTELYKFENSLPYDPRLIEARFTQFIGSLIEAGTASGRVYVTPEIEPQYTEGYARIPHGLTFRLVRPGEDADWREVPVVIDSPPLLNSYVDGITMLAARAELNNALYLEREGVLSGAKRAAARAVAIRPDFQQARVILEKIQN